MASRFPRVRPVMTQTILHFVFTDSGAGCLVEALREADRDDHVIASSDAMNLGPINPADPSMRTKWVEAEFGWTDCSSSTVGSKRLWNETLFPNHRKIAWLSRRSAAEYAGFLEWLWRLGEAPCEVVDMTDVEVSYRPEHGPPRPPVLAMSLALLSHHTIRKNKLWDLAEPLQAAARRRYHDVWRQLRSENAPLRVIDGDKLVSAPITFFDAKLLSYAKPDWQKVSNIFAQMLLSEANDTLIQTDQMLVTGHQCHGGQRHS
ncbi:MAG: DUF1835 domain-containing protein [Alphaproteobacteria bacterium]|nr:MAG: DUF1835 domain-containing protein [Alphaproteobacteria bacterium]